MELRRILYFIETAKCSSFTRAAENLGISQPALSYQISILERESKITLFDRSQKKIRLTLQGERFLQGALKLKDSYLELMSSESSEQKEPEGQYIISSGGTVAAWILPDVIKNISKKYSRISFHVLEGDAVTTRDSVLKGTCDLGILTEEIHEEGISSKIFLSDKIVPVVSKNHPLSGKKKIHVDDILKEKFVLFHKDSSIRRLIEKNINTKYPQFNPDVVMELRGVESVIRSVKAGLGIGFLSALSINKDLRLLNCEELSVERTFYLSYRKSIRTLQFVDIFEKYSQKH